MRKILLLTLLSINCFFTGIYAASYISFNNVYSVSAKTVAKVTTNTLLTGSSFKLTSTNTFTNAGSAAKALYYVTLEYKDTNGNIISYPGMVQTDINSGSASQALLFEQTTSLGVQTLVSPAVYFILVVPTNESAIIAGTQYTLNATYKASYLPPITTIQDNNIAPLITSNGGGATATINMAGNVKAVTTVTATE